MYVCDNCGKRFENSDALNCAFPDIPNLTKRIEPGGTVPAGECPWCAALVYPCDHDEPKVLAALEHAYDRLNAIPHRYAETDFKLIREAIQQAKEPVRVLVLLDGGLVQDVLTDTSGVEATVLDQDIEGILDEDIVEIVGPVDALRGTLSAHEPTVASAIIQSAWRALQ